MHKGLGRRRQGCWMIYSRSKEVKSNHQTTNQDNFWVEAGGRGVPEHRGEGMHSPSMSSFLSTETGESYKVVIFIAYEVTDVIYMYSGNIRVFNCRFTRRTQQAFTSDSRWAVFVLFGSSEWFFSQIKHLEFVLSLLALLDLNWWGDVRTATLTSSGQ